MNTKYKVRKDISKTFRGKTIYRIEALKDFADVKIGDLGGWVERELNLSDKGNCWIYDNSIIGGFANVCDHAEIGGNSKIKDNVTIGDKTKTTDYVIIKDDATISANIILMDNVIIKSDFALLLTDNKLIRLGGEIELSETLYWGDDLINY